MGRWLSEGLNETSDFPTSRSFPQFFAREAASSSARTSLPYRVREDASTMASWLATQLLESFSLVLFPFPPSSPSFRSLHSRSLRTTNRRCYILLYPAARRSRTTKPSPRLTQLPHQFSFDSGLYPPRRSLRRLNRFRCPLQTPDCTDEAYAADSSCLEPRSGRRSTTKGGLRDEDALLGAQNQREIGRRVLHCREGR